MYVVWSSCWNRQSIVLWLILTIVGDEWEEKGCSHVVAKPVSVTTIMWLGNRMLKTYLPNYI